MTLKNFNFPSITNYWTEAEKDKFYLIFFTFRTQLKSMDWEKKKDGGRTGMRKQRAQNTSCWGEYFFINWRKTKTYQVFSFSDADVYKYKKLKNSWSVREMNSKAIFCTLPDHYGCLKANQQPKTRMKIFTSLYFMHVII